MSFKRWMIAFCLFLFFTGSVIAATFNVNNAADAVDSNPGNGICAAASGFCTLRAAVMETRALAGLDVINVPFGNYVLTIPGTGEDLGATGDLDIDSVEIRGTGLVFVNGNGLDRVFDIYNSSTLQGLIIQNGLATGHGGGVRCNFTCIIDEVTIRSNTATGSGGGIRNQGDLIINDSTISGNSCVTHGGGISNLAGTISATDITVTGNMANFDSGGVDNDGGGTTSLINTTVTNNTADQNDDGDGNGGGIKAFSGNITVWNTILANNIDRGDEAPDCEQIVNSQRHNLIRDLSNCIVVGDIDGNIYGVDPQLGPLADNGGPTLTHALLLGSPAINVVALDRCGELDDQRGVTRPQGPLCDIGSYEFEFSYLYADNFEDGDASDWTPNKGIWSVMDGDLTGSHDRKATNIAPFVGCGVGCTVLGYLRINNLTARASLIAFYQDKRNLVEVILMEDKQKVVLKQRQDGQIVVKAKANTPVIVGIDYPVKVRQLGGLLEVEINGALLISIPTPISSSGGAGFRVKSTTGTSISASFEEIFVN